jgi:hypothetical protein
MYIITIGKEEIDVFQTKVGSVWFDVNWNKNLFTATVL